MGFEDNAGIERLFLLIMEDLQDERFQLFLIL